MSELRASAYTLIATVALAAVAFAQMDPPELMWAREYFTDDMDGKLRCVVGCAAGGYLVAEYSYSSESPMTGGVMKLTTEGDVVWMWNPGYYISSANWVQELSDGTVITCGVGKPTEASEAGVYIARLTAVGSTIWIKSYPAEGSDCYCIEPLPDGGYAAAAAINSNDSWLLRTDSMGDTLWTRVWDNGGYDRFRRVVYQDEGLTVFASATTPRLLRYTMDGNLLWVRTCPGFGGPGYPGSMCLASDSGYVTMDTGEWDGVIAHTDWEGEVLWQYLIPGEWSRNGSSLSRTMDGGYLVSGWNGYYPPIQDSNPETHDGWLVRFDSLGQYKWVISNEILRDNYFNSTCQLTEGGYVIAGQIWDEVNTGWNGYLLRYAPETGIEGGEFSQVPLSLFPSCNPFTSSVTITCSGSSLPGQLMVYDLAGRLIRSLSDRQGSSFLWDGRDATGADVPPGTYLIQGAIDGQVSSIRIVKL